MLDGKLTAHANSLSPRPSRAERKAPLHHLERTLFSAYWESHLKKLKTDGAGYEYVTGLGVERMSVLIFVEEWIPR